MINKENDKKEVDDSRESSIVDVAKMDVQCHLMIRDKDTGEVVVNKRG